MFTVRNSFFPDRYALFLAKIILATGAMVRIKVYLENRSLFIDEANLARNIVERPISGFFSALDYQQYAPPIFLGAVKGIVSLLGPSEYGLRLLPLLASLGSLFLVYRLSAKWISAPWPRLIPVFLVAFSYEMIRYATECKQYSLDVFMLLLLLQVVLARAPDAIGKGHLLAWAAIGAIVPWVSMPIVFSLAGIGLYYGLAFLRKQQNQKLLLLCLAILCWLASFGLYYQFLLRPDIESDYLHTYHLDYFLPLLPTSSADWSKWSELILVLFRITSGYTAMAYLVAIPAFLWGARSLVLKKDGSFWLLGTPLVTCLLASGLEQYSLLPRLVLFLIPVMAIFMGIGTDQLWHKKSWTPWVLLAIWLPVLPLTGGLIYIVKPLQVEETRAMLRMCMSEPRGQVVYVHHEAVPAATFYRDYHSDSSAFRQKPLYLSRWDETPGILYSTGVPSAWVVFSHLINDNTRRDMNQQMELAAQVGTISDTLSTRGTLGFLFLTDN